MCRLPQTGIHGTRTFSTVLLVFPVIIFTVLLTIGPGHAASGSDDVITVSLPVGDDLYFAGGRVVVSKTVKGDLLAAGGTVIINGPVGGDLIIAGGSLFVNAPVKDDLRAAGGDLVLSSPVSGDLLVLGGNVTVPAGVVIEGDAVIAAGSLYMGGTVAGDLMVQAGDLELDGTVQGNAKLYATDRISLRGRVEGETVFSATRAELGPEVRFGKDVSYWREAGEMEFDPELVGGEARFDPELRGREKRVPSLPRDRKALLWPGGFFFATLLSGMVVVAGSVLLFKGVLRQAGNTLHKAFWQSTGIGLLVILLLPVAAILAMVTLVGMPVGLFLLAAFFFCLIFGRVIAAAALAAWLERRRVAQWSTARLVLVSVGLYAAIKLLGLVPLLGWLVVLFAVLAGYGSIVLGIYRQSTAP